MPRSDSRGRSRSPKKARLGLLLTASGFRALSEISVKFWGLRRLILFRVWGLGFGVGVWGLFSCSGCLVELGFRELQGLEPFVNRKRSLGPRKVLSGLFDPKQ